MPPTMRTPSRSLPCAPVLAASVPTALAMIVLLVPSTRTPVSFLEATLPDTTFSLPTTEMPLSSVAGTGHAGLVETDVVALHAVVVAGDHHSVAAVSADDVAIVRCSVSSRSGSRRRSPRRRSRLADAAVVGQSDPAATTMFRSPVIVSPSPLLSAITPPFTTFALPVIITPVVRLVQVERLAADVGADLVALEVVPIAGDLDAVGRRGAGRVVDRQAPDHAVVGVEFERPRGVDGIDDDAGAVDLHRRDDRRQVGGRLDRVPRDRREVERR